ncbi:21755_t:CDS:2, partial [Gigaspora margarita]
AIADKLEVAPIDNLFFLEFILAALPNVTADEKIKIWGDRSNKFYD